MRHLDQDMMLLDVLVKPCEWRIISNFFPPDIQPASALSPHGRTLQQGNHIHPFHQVAIILDGEEYLILLGKVYRCVPMTLVYIGAWEPHAFYPVDLQRPSTSFRIDLQHGRVFTRRVTRQVGGAEVYDVHLIPLPGEPGQALDEQWQILQQRNGSSLLVKRARLIHATASLLAELLDDQARGQRARALSREELFSAIKDMMSANYGQNLTLEMLSSLTGYSRFHFARLFKQFTGQTVHEFTDLCRYEKACQFAEQGASPKQIAAVLGFSSATAFFHWRTRWRRRSGITANGHEQESSI